MTIQKLTEAVLNGDLEYVKNHLDQRVNKTSYTKNSLQEIFDIALQKGHLRIADCLNNYQSQ